MMQIRRMAVCLVLLGTALTMSATPADAHALLLRTAPSPQSTVRSSPASVNLFFSEAVEAAFGAVRVFDVDGRRVDTAAVSRSDANRELRIAVPRLRDGTFTVTWRVVSADGHAVHGGFSFYVGAPSTISPVLIPGDHGAGRLVGWGYGVVRFLWFTALSATTGLVLIRRFVWTPALRSAGLGSRDVSRDFRQRWRRWIVAAWIALAFATALTLVFQTAAVSGLGPLASMHPGPLGQVLRTSFGEWWSVQAALIVVGVAAIGALRSTGPMTRWTPSRLIAVLGLVGIGLCVAEAANGHARTESHPLVATLVLSVHLAAIAVWVGGLGVLLAALWVARGALDPAERAAITRSMVGSFGRIALAATVVVVASGTVEAIGDMAALSDLWRTPWGRALTVKVVLFTAAIALAARHRLVTAKRLGASRATPPEVAGGAMQPEIARFRRTAQVEIGALLGALGVASALIVLVPGRSVALAANGPVNQDARIGGYTVQLLLDPSQLGDNQAHLTYSDLQGLAAGAITTTTLSLGPDGAPLTAVAMRLISPGHFVGDVTLPSPGRYRAFVTLGEAHAATSFRFRMRAGATSHPTVGG